MCTTPGMLEEERQRQIEEELATIRGYEYYQHSLQLEPGQRIQESDLALKRLRARIEMSQSEVDRLKNNAPPAPDFDVLSEQQVSELGYWDKKRYGKKVKAYKKTREKWEASDQGEEYHSVVGRVEERAEKKEAHLRGVQWREDEAAAQKDVRKGREKEPLFTLVASTPEAMEAALDKMDDDGNLHIEKRLGEIEIYHALTRLKPEDRTTAIAAMTACVHKSHVYMNKYLRNGQLVLGFEQYGGIGYEKLAPTLVNLMSYTSLSRDVVVRRGVKGLSALAGMLDGGKSGNLSPEEMAEAMRAKLREGDVILSDPGVVSTSVRKDAGKPALPEVKTDGTEVPGIEFVILVKKGTHAMDISGYNLYGRRWEDQEMIIAPGTQFRVVRAFFNDGKDDVREGDGENAGNLHKEKKGTGGNWKIYLETIPGSGPSPSFDD